MIKPDKQQVFAINNRKVLRNSFAGISIPGTKCAVIQPVYKRIKD
jgi:hypothetical protein